MGFEVKRISDQDIPFVEGLGGGHQADAIIQPPFVPGDELIHEITGERADHFGKLDDRIKLKHLASTAASSHVRIEARAVPAPEEIVETTAQRLGEYLSTLDNDPDQLAELLARYQENPVLLAREYHAPIPLEDEF